MKGKIGYRNPVRRLTRDRIRSNDLTRVLIFLLLTALGTRFRPSAPRDSRIVPPRDKSLLREN